jgi:hypothetical protein
MKKVVVGKEGLEGKKEAGVDFAREGKEGQGEYGEGNGGNVVKERKQGTS